MQQDVEHHVFRRDVLLQLADELEANRLRDFHHREAGVHQVRVFGGADAPCERVVHAAHARVAVGGLDEIAGIDDELARHFVADARRDVVGRGKVAATGVVLKIVLQLS